jgi:hypothetical protein
MTINSSLNNIRVVIFGEATPNTIHVLGPDSSIWKEMDYVKEVLMIPHCPSIPPHEFPVSPLKTVFIPLFEKDAITPPMNFYSLYPSHKNLSVLSNKKNFYSHMKHLGFAHLCPEHYEIKSPIKFPCVLKRVDLKGSDGVQFVASREQLSCLMESTAWRGHSVVLQKFIEGKKDYVSHLICRDGKIIWHTSFEYGLCEQNPIRSLTNMEYLRLYTPERNILLQFEACLIQLGYSGPCNIDYKLTEDGKLKIFEINPRLGGSLLLPECKNYLKEAIKNLILGALSAQGKSLISSLTS